MWFTKLPMCGRSNPRVNLWVSRINFSMSLSWKKVSEGSSYEEIHRGRTGTSSDPLTSYIPPHQMENLDVGGNVHKCLRVCSSRSGLVCLLFTRFASHGALSLWIGEDRFYEPLTASTQARWCAYQLLCVSKCVSDGVCLCVVSGKWQEVNICQKLRGI